MEPDQTFASLRVVVSNTGPLISALQCDCMHILRQFYDLIHIASSELAELEELGAAVEIRAMIETEFIAVRNLTDSERVTARAIAEEITQSSMSRDKDPVHHYPEAEAIVLMERGNLEAVELLVDELAARETARRRRIAIVGFPGLLIRACQQDLLTPEQVRDTLIECQRQGTHYSNQFIAEIYQRLRRD